LRSREYGKYDIEANPKRCNMERAVDRWTASPVEGYEKKGKGRS